MYLSIARIVSLIVALVLLGAVEGQNAISAACPAGFSSPVQVPGHGVFCYALSPASTWNGAEATCVASGAVHGHLAAWRDAGQAASVIGSCAGLVQSGSGSPSSWFVGLHSQLIVGQWQFAAGGNASSFSPPWAAGQPNASVAAGQPQTCTIASIDASSVPGSGAGLVTVPCDVAGFSALACCEAPALPVLGPCPPGFTPGIAAPHFCYASVGNGVTWDAADTLCKAAAPGASLASVIDAATASDALQYCAGRATSGAWRLGIRAADVAQTTNRRGLWLHFSSGYLSSYFYSGALDSAWVSGEPNIWWDNAAMIALFESNPADKAMIETCREHWKFNAYVFGPNNSASDSSARLYKPGDFLIHFAGVYEPLSDYARGAE